MGLPQWGLLRLSHAGNVVIFFGLGLFCLVLRKDWIPPIRKGFFCSDQSLRYPLKEEAVSTGVLLLLGQVATAAIVFLTEYWCSRKKDNGRAPTPPPPQSGQKKHVKVAGFLCKYLSSPWLLRAASNYAINLFGLIVTAVLTDLGKVSTGVLRPNFFASCRPNVSCAAAGLDRSMDVYHMAYTCLSADAEEELDLRKSFPSGHASVVAYMSVFVSLFVQDRGSFCFLLRPLIQVCVLSLSWVISLTRVSDHVHHISDIVVGFVLGALVAVWTAHLVRQNEAGTAASDSEEEEESVDKAESQTPRKVIADTPPLNMGLQTGIYSETGTAKDIEHAATTMPTPSTSSPSSSSSSPSTSVDPSKKTNNHHLRALQNGSKDMVRTFITDRA